MTYFVYKNCLFIGGWHGDICDLHTFTQTRTVQYSTVQYSTDIPSSHLSHVVYDPHYYFMRVFIEAHKDGVVYYRYDGEEESVVVHSLGEISLREGNGRGTLQEKIRDEKIREDKRRRDEKREEKRREGKR